MIKIISKKRYNELLGTIENQNIEIGQQKSVNDTLYVNYIKTIDEVGRKNKELEDAKFYNNFLQERLNASQKQIKDLSQENRHLEAEIERAKKRV